MNDCMIPIVNIDSSRNIREYNRRRRLSSQDIGDLSFRYKT